MQDLPKGLHGFFPVRNGNKVHLAGGGEQAAYSQATTHYVFTF
jgi:hypothetical protein